MILKDVLIKSHWDKRKSTNNKGKIFGCQLHINTYKKGQGSKKLGISTTLWIHEWLKGLSLSLAFHECYI